MTSNLQQDDLYTDVAANYGPRSTAWPKPMKSTPIHPRDLLQGDLDLLWRSLEHFDQRCSLRTWVYRVAHNVAASHVIRDQRIYSHELVTLEAAESKTASEPDAVERIDESRALERRDQRYSQGTRGHRLRSIDLRSSLHERDS
jgi:RNA polymerase sigma-70 factor, ECF subfamily